MRMKGDNHGPTWENIQGR